MGEGLTQGVEFYLKVSYVYQSGLWVLEFRFEGLGFKVRV